MTGSIWAGGWDNIYFDSTIAYVYKKSISLAKKPQLPLIPYAVASSALRGLDVLSFRLSVVYCLHDPLRRNT
jgi:hypothetical protein